MLHTYPSEATYQANEARRAEFETEAHREQLAAYAEYGRSRMSSVRRRSGILLMRAGGRLAGLR